MKRPAQRLLDPIQDGLFHRMVAAYGGDPATGRAIALALRDAIVDHARRRSPYYREVIGPDAAFEDIPILTKPILRRRLDDLLAEGVPAERRYPVRTSGSTGEPVSLFRDTSQLLFEDPSGEQFSRWLHGVPLEATMVTVTSRGLGPPYRRFAHRVRKRLARPGVRASLDPFLYGTTMATLTPERVRRELDIWQSFEQAFVVGHASGIHWIADQIRRQGIQLRRPPVAIATNADMLDPHAHAAIEATFGVRVHTRYGSREMNRIATSLPGTIDRYAFNPFLVYAEVVDDAGRPVPPGVPGRLVLTDLNNLVMPLIRYDLGDIAIASDEIAGGFPVIEQILGRSSEVLTLPSGKVLATVTIGNVLFLEQDMGSWVRFYQCAQTAENELELRVVWEDEPPPGLRERMVELLGSAADPDTVIRVRDVDDVGRLPSGKVWVVRREF